MKEYIFKSTSAELAGKVQSGTINKPYLAYLTDLDEYNYNSLVSPYASFTKEAGVVTKSISKKAVSGDSLYIHTIEGCPTTVSTEANWITLASSAVTGDSWVSFDVARNDGEVTRTAEIVIDFWPEEYHSGDVKNVKAILTIEQSAIINWTEEPLTIIFEEDASDVEIRFNIQNVYYYSYNDGAWQESYPQSVSSGDTLAIKCKPTTNHYIGSSTYIFSELPQFSVAGNLMSIAAGDDYLTADTASVACRYMFRNSRVRSAANLYIPNISSPAQYMTGGMFIGCSNLTTPPAALPSTLANNYASQMFSGCTELTAAPALPATSLTLGCYSQMFRGCTLLATAPELPAPTIVSGSSASNGPYVNMFNGCTLLGYIKCLATNATDTNTVNNWVTNVASEGTFVKKKDSIWNEGNSGIPAGWTVQEVD